MPISDHEELGVNLLAQQSGDSIAGVPIKKRRFILSQFSSPTQTPSLPPEDSERPWKKLCILEAESSASESSAQPALGTDFITDGSLEAKGESLDNRDVDTACGHENHMESNVQELELKTAATAIKGTSVVKDSNMDDKSVLLSGMQNNQLLSTLKGPSELPVGDSSGEEKFASSDKSAFQRVASMSGWQLTSSRDGKDTGDSSVKQDKVDHLPLGVRHTIIHNNCSNLSSRFDPVHHCVNRSNWDLNVPMDTWDSSASVSVMAQDGHDGSTYGGMHKKKLETPPVRMTPGESSNMLQKSNSLRAGNFSRSSDDHNRADVGLDLQLKPPSRPELRINWGAMALPDLSLSLAGSTIDISSKAVKPEPYEEASQNDSWKVETVSLKSEGFRHVKPEPCDGSSQGKKDSELACSRDNKSACAGMVKSEPPEEPSQDSLKRLTGKSPDIESDNHRLMSYHAEGRPDASETKAMDLNSEAVSVDDDLHDGSKMPVSAGIPASKSGGATVGLVSQAVIPDSNKNDRGELHNSACLFQDEEGNDIKTSDLASKSQISEEKGLNSVSETCEVAGQASNSLTEPVVSGGEKEPAVFDGMSEGSAEMDCSDDDNNIASSNLVAVDEHQVDSYGNSKVGESSQERIHLSVDIQTKKSNYDGHGSISFHNANDAREKTLKKRDGDDEYEDRVRDSMLMSHGANMSLPKKGSKDVLGKETVDTFGPTGMPTVMRSNMDAKEKETELDEMKTGHSTEKIIRVLCNSNNDLNLSSTKDVHESSVMEIKKASSSKTKFIKTAHKITENHPLKEKGSELTSKSTGSTSAKNIAKSSEGDKGPRHEDTRGSVPSSKHLISSKKNSPLNGVAIKHIDGWDRNSEIKKVNSASNRSSFGNTKSPYARSISFLTERERLTDKLHWRERPQPRGARNDRCSDRTFKYESGKNEHQPVEKHGSDFINNRKADDRLGALYCNRNSGPPGDPELHEQKFFRFSRPYSRGEAAFAVESDGSVRNTGRIGRRLLENEPPRLSRFPPRRRSPVPREVLVPSDVQIAGPSVRDVSPSRYIGRDVPDPLLLSREEKIMRALPEDMMDPLPFPHPHPRLLYEHVDNDLIRRQRRSHSPIHRRIPARFHRAHSPHQWSPSRRLSDVLDGHPELIRCRSPPAFRMDRLRSPHQRPCFPEDVMVRRHGSPPPFPRLLDGMRDIHPLEEHDLPRPGRVLQRNIRRFDFVGPQESADEEYFGPSFPASQLHELEGDDEFVARKKFDERRGFLHPFVQRPIVSNDGENCLPYPVEDGPRPIRFCPEAEEMFPDRGSPQDFDGRIGNRIGNIPNRLRGMAERGDDYRYHGAPGWHEGGLNDARLKRRRL
uniref:LOW QUALITY PROTEIN: uncharacterized protein LOC105044520 n=1 Tax=Elaeis guineensis var. tenera TaxID=51953 RepID=A0A8N4EZ17_ELAGV|nr:LOW QUALITY PROTEIN: uncharacterized protein LOC105044520 [Elaeis guineensis]